MRLGRVDHITFNVTDMDGAVQFFQKLGMRIEGSLDNGDIMFLWNGDEGNPLQIQLDRIKEGETNERYSRPGLNHIGFIVEDLEEAASEVETAGIKGLRQPFYQSRSGRTIFTFPGPEGVYLQFARRDGRGEYEDFK